MKRMMFLGAVLIGLMPGFASAHGRGFFGISLGLPGVTIFGGSRGGGFAINAYPQVYYGGGYCAAPVYSPPVCYDPPACYSPPACYNPPACYTPPVVYAPPACYQPPVVYAPAPTYYYPPTYYYRSGCYGGYYYGRGCYYGR